jgi:hypothetical protein
MRVNHRGVRINPNLKLSEDIYAQIAAHRARRKETTSKQIEQVLDN